MWWKRNDWLLNCKHEESSNYAVWVWFFNIFLNTSAFLKGRFNWTCWNGFCSPVSALYVFHPWGRHSRSWYWFVTTWLLWFPAPLSILASIAAGMVTLASVCVSAAPVPALPLKSRVNCLWATCSSVASGEAGPSAAVHVCTALLILVQAFLCIFCVNSSTFQLLGVESENFQVLLAFFA